jgi:hypothetical protein
MEKRLFTIKKEVKRQRLSKINYLKAQHVHYTEKFRPKPKKKKA